MSGSSGWLAWLACKVIPEAHNQETYDLFIGEVIGAWADARVFKNGHWHFDHADPQSRSLHYIAGGLFYAIGVPVIVRDDRKLSSGAQVPKLLSATPFSWR